MSRDVQRHRTARRPEPAEDRPCPTTWRRTCSTRAIVRATTCRCTSRIAERLSPGIGEPAADRSGDRRDPFGAVRRIGHAVELRARREGRSRRRHVLATTSPCISIKWEDLQVFRSFMGVNVGGNADSDVTANGVEATLTLQPSEMRSTSIGALELRTQRARRGRSGDRRPGRRAAAGHSGVDVLAVGQLRLPARLARRRSSAAASPTRMSARRRSTAASATAAWSSRRRTRTSRPTTT